jgi:RimJ/RimL family protein N-acetyltransferase
VLGSEVTRIEQFSPAREKAAHALLLRSPYEHVFLTYLLLFDFAPSTRESIYLAVQGDRLTGVAFFGRQVVLASEDDATTVAFAEFARERHGERMIVGPRRTIERFWSLLAPHHAPPRVVRKRQFVMAIDRNSLRPPEAEPAVVARRARMDEWTAVADNSAMMIAQELEYDPRRSSPEFTANVRSMIERGLWWVGDSYGRLCFFCNIGPWSAQTAQLQGIWTPPELRGRGLATAALGALCKHLLELSPTLSLYVNDFNTAAIRLYERVGFRTVAEFQTLLF